MKRIVRTEIDKKSDGMLLLELLSSRFTYHDRKRWEGLIAEQRLLVNGRPAGSAVRLRVGDVLEYRLPAVPEPAVPREFGVIYEDEAIFVVDKPAGLPVHPAGRFFHHTLWALLKKQRPDETFAFVNRLDRETSGIVLLGRTPAATRGCRKQMESRRIGKAYLVLVEGKFPAEMTADGWLAPDPASPIRKKRRYTASRPAALPERTISACMTHFRGLAHGDAGVSLVLARPRTGRTHQIRATLAGLGFPVVGDKLYGRDESVFLRYVRNGSLTPADRTLLRLPRQALHAWRLSFRHPCTGMPVRVEAEFPADMMNLCAVLGLKAAAQALPEDDA